MSSGCLRVASEGTSERVRPTFDSPLEEHLAAAAGYDPVVAPRGLVGAHQADLVRLPAGLGLARHRRTAGLSRPGRRAEMSTETEREREREGREKYVNTGELHVKVKMFKAGCRRGLVAGIDGMLRCC